ncbi:ribonuclease H-like domain-containing protein [Tanacetum coccineum]
MIETSPLWLQARRRVAPPRYGLLGLKGFLVLLKLMLLVMIVTTAGSSYNCWLKLLLLLKIKEKVLSPVTTKEKIQKKNDVKARSMLLMTLPNEHLMTFNQYKDAKTLFASIQTRFGGNKATKKTQKTLMKQMYENFSAPSTESLDSIFNRLQKIWNTHVVVWRNKLVLDTMSFDDLYNNFKIVEQEVKRTASSSSILSSQNKAFVSSPSSTNEVNTAYEFRYDKSKVECFNCHKMGHFAKDCRRPKNQDSRNKNQDSSKRTVNVEETSFKAMMAIDRAGFDWSYMADDEVPTNMALMDFFQTLRIESNKSEFNLATYKRGLASIEEQLVFYKKNEGPIPQKEDQPMLIVWMLKRHIQGTCPISHTIEDVEWRICKFDGKGFFVGYSLNSKVFRVYNIRTRKVKEKLHIMFLEDKPIIASDGPKWLFDINSHKINELCPVVADGSLFDFSSKNASNDDPQPFSDAGKKDDEATHADFSSDETEVDMSNITTTYPVPSTPNTRIHKDHSLDHVIGDVQFGVQIRRMTKTTNEQGFISDVYKGKTHEDLHTCLFACFFITSRTQEGDSSFDRSKLDRSNVG